MLKFILLCILITNSVSSFAYYADCSADNASNDCLETICGLFDEHGEKERQRIHFDDCFVASNDVYECFGGQRTLLNIKNVRGEKALKIGNYSYICLKGKTFQTNDKINAAKFFLVENTRSKTYANLIYLYVDAESE